MFFDGRWCDSAEEMFSSAPVPLGNTNTEGSSLVDDPRLVPEESPPVHSTQRMKLFPTTDSNLKNSSIVNNMFPFVSKHMLGSVNTVSV